LATPIIRGRKNTGLSGVDGGGGHRQMLWVAALLLALPLASPPPQ
jgi:hypothetical protein